MDVYPASSILSDKKKLYNNAIVKVKKDDKATTARLLLQGFDKEKLLTYVAKKSKKAEVPVDEKSDSGEETPEGLEELLGNSEISLLTQLNSNNTDTQSNVCVLI